MKSERRHELQHNDLAEWLVHAGAAVKPYQNMILSAVLVVLALAVGYTIWMRMAASESANAWNAVSTALDSGDMSGMAKVIDEYPSTSAAHTAGVVLADNYLAVGCNQLFSNKATGLDELAKAIRIYDAVLAESRQPSLRERATFGLARAKESKGDAESIEQSEKLYAEVVANWPEGAFARAASERLADLKRPATKEFYDLFAKFDPKPAFSDTPEKPEFKDSNVPKEDEKKAEEKKEEVKPEKKEEQKKEEKKKE
jgi:hypothetical protein